MSQTTAAPGQADDATVWKTFCNATLALPARAGFLPLFGDESRRG